MFDQITTKIAHGVAVTMGMALLFASPTNHGAMAQSPIKFTNFRFVELRGLLGHEGLFEIDGQPVVGVAPLGAARLDGGVSAAHFRLVDEAGSKLKDINLVLGGHPAASSRQYVGTIELPNVPFRVAVSGTDSGGRAFDFTFATLFQARSVSVRFDPASVEIRPGTTLLYGTVTNFGAVDTFQLTAPPNDFVAAISPPTLTLSTDRSGSFEVQVSVPTETPELTIVPVTVVATSSTDPRAANEASVDLFVVRPDGKPLTIRIQRVVALVSDKGRVVIRGALDLAADSDGIDPVIEPVSVSFHAFVEGIAPGSFAASGRKFRLDREEFPGVQRVTIDRYPRSGGQKTTPAPRRFEVMFGGIDLTGVDFDRPIMFAMGIGDDVGEIMLSRSAGYPFVVRVRRDRDEVELESREERDERD